MHNRISQVYEGPYNNVTLGRPSCGKRRLQSILSSHRLRRQFEFADDPAARCNRPANSCPWLFSLLLYSVLLRRCIHVVSCTRYPSPGGKKGIFISALSKPRNEHLDITPDQTPLTAENYKLTRSVSTSAPRPFPPSFLSPPPQHLCAQNH